MSNKITVIGAGTMGNGIAHTFAQFGGQVVLADLQADALEKAKATIFKNLDRMEAKGIITDTQNRETRHRITFLPLTSSDDSLQQAISEADLVVEAIVEKADIKEALFRKLDALAPDHTILASNTSSISITRLAAATKRPEQVIGMHFMNPVPVMKLVEVIRGYATSDQTCQQVMNMTRSLEKIPVEVNDYPGFVSNRILMPMINEAITSLFEGVAGVEAIDTVMKLGMAHPMGPLQLADFIGLDVCLNILRVLHEGLGKPHYVPCPLLVNMVQAGKLGVKTGEGFYSYPVESKNFVVSPRFIQ